MKQRFAKTLPLLLAGALQVMPMLRTALPVVTQGFTPSGWAIVLKLAGAAAVFGLGHHAVSAASSLSTPATATVGVAYTGAVTYSGGHAGSVSSWQVTQNWQGASVPISSSILIKCLSSTRPLAPRGEMPSWKYLPRIA